MSKVLLVTGASSDVGTALIESIVDDYDTVVCHYRSRPIKFSGPKFVRLQADLSDEAQTVQFAETAANYGVTHFVHLPAKASYPERFAKQSWSKFEEEINISLRSAVILSGKLLPQMAKTKFGKVVFMLTSYTVAEPPQKQMTPYVTSKFALLGLMKTLAAEYADKGITVHGISPSMIDTFFLGGGTNRLIAEQNAAKSPIKRNLVPADVVGAFKWLLSDSADCVTGQNIAVTAGN
jgi:3-oxoacyl-[acyl-carrier protein] reductase